MKKFIEISVLRYINKIIPPKHICSRPEQITEEVITKQIMPIDNIKKVYDTNPTLLLICNDKENKLEYIDIKNTYDEIKNKMGDLLC